MKLTLRAPSTLLCAALALAGVAWWTVPAVAAGTAVNEVRFPLRDLKVWQKGGEAQVLLRGVANRARPGEPELPGGNVAVEIPAGARVTGWQVVPLDPIEVPAQAHLGTLKAWQTGDGQTAHGPAPVQLDPAAWFPGRPFEELHVGFLQGHTVASVAVRPLQYLASQGRLRLVTRFRLSVSYEEAGGTMPLARIRRTERTEAVTARALGALGLPYQPQPNTRVGRGGAFPMAPGQYPGPLGHEAAYLIVTPDSLVSAFQPLADWKTRQGISTRIVTLSQVQASYPQGVDLQEKIRLCVRDAYLYQGTQWLLLGGTGQLIPPRYAASQLLPDAPVPTDIYYSNLDGNWNANANSLFGEAFVDSSTPGDGVDLYPEVYVGRAPVLNTAEATV
ncbi:MAG TPA: C25 family cysteine peptidase, partial [Candidatus Saccharimonadales bacterium]|nr:C25 family cysteine peptidase [Candidatus Saccharimonadales bacterium]